MATQQTTRKRFATVSREEYENILKNKDSEATRKATVKAVKILRTYLREKGQCEDFEKLSKAELDSTLCLFYVEIRRLDGEYYKTASLNSIRAGICRHLKDNGKSGIDLLKDTEFEESNTAFKAALVQLKDMGKGDTVPHTDIDENDMDTLFSSGVLNDNTPYALQHKVWFELMIYICRRGRENLRKLTKDHFAVNTDSKGRKYVYQSRDEMTKKVREDSTSSRVDKGRMYATGTVGCPVASYEKYVSKLNDNCEAFFQTPKGKTPTDDETPWYKNSPVGTNQLGKFMSIISKEAKLSKVYTNHCLRSTCISILDSSGFANRDICRVSGHQNEASINSYVRRVSDNKKQCMSNAISASIGHVPVVPVPTPPPVPMAMPSPNPSGPSPSPPMLMPSHNPPVPSPSPPVLMPSPNPPGPSPSLPGPRPSLNLPGPRPSPSPAAPNLDSQLAQVLQSHIMDMVETDSTGTDINYEAEAVGVPAVAVPTAAVSMNHTTKSTMQNLKQQHPMVLNNCNVTINYNYFNNSQ